MRVFSNDMMMLDYIFFQSPIKDTCTSSSLFVPSSSPSTLHSSFISFSATVSFSVSPSPVFFSFSPSPSELFSSFLSSCFSSPSCCLLLPLPIRRLQHSLASVTKTISTHWNVISCNIMLVEHSFPFYQPRECLNRYRVFCGYTARKEDYLTQHI